MKKYPDKSKAKTIFNYTCKTLLRIASLKCAEFNCSRGLPSEDKIDYLIKKILEKIEKSSRAASFTRYQIYLNLLIEKINLYAQKKAAEEYIIISENLFINDIKTFIELCKKCLRSSYDLSCDFWQEPYEEIPLNLLIVQRAQNKLSSKIITQDSLLAESLQQNDNVDTFYAIDDNPIMLDDVDKFRKEFKIGIILSKLKFYSSNQDEHTKTLKLLLSTPIYNTLFNNGNFDFKSICFDFFFSKDLPFSSLAGIGYICGYYVYEHHLQNGDTPVLFNDNLKRKFLVRLDNFACIKDTTSFLYLLNEICELSEEGQCENILRFINPNIYDSDNTIHTTVRIIVENGVFNCNSIADALQYLITTRKYAKTTGNVQIIEACDWLIDKIEDDTIDDDYFQDRQTYKLWASDSLWPDTDYFENLCMDLIEVITISNKTRISAIEASELLLLTANKSHVIERDIQIYERVLLEFNTATDEDYNELRETLMD